MKKLMLFCGILFFPFIGSAAYQQSDTLRTANLDSIVVNAHRAGANTPVTYSEVTGYQMRKENASHSLPMMLALQPSVVATTEGGLGLGYSNFTVRGTDDTRTNVTLNGISLNDSESQKVFWVNMPAIHQFTGSVQLQRGVGTSAAGAGAFGANLSIVTSSLCTTPSASASFSLGSYNTYLTSVAASTGIGRSGWSMNVVYSHGETDGYIRNAKADLNSLYIQTALSRGNHNLQLSYIMGDQASGITWEGISPQMYEQDRRYNIAGEYYDDQGNVCYYDNETDNYTQHHVQVSYTHDLSSSLSWNTSFNYTRGDGYYENYKADTKFSKYGLQSPEASLKKSDFIIQQAMANDYYAFNTAINYNASNLNASAAVSYGYYDGNHFGDVLWSKHMTLDNPYRWYENNGLKKDYSGYLRAEWNPTHNTTIFADLQYRGVSYKLEGPDKDFALLDWKKEYNFFNPKAGFTYAPGDNSRIYASVAVAHREPSRSDIKESIKSASANMLKAEQLIDVELGYRLNTEKIAFSANLYLMEYKDQLVATGRLTDVGYVIKENIPDSYRRGVELAAAWNINRTFTLEGNITLSKNKALDYTACVDTYDNPDNWNPLPQKEIQFSKTNLILSPEVVGMVQLSAHPGAGFECRLNGKFVGKQYMDNLNSKESEVPAYFVSAFNVSRNFKIGENPRALNIALSVDNLFNNKYWSYGWIYQAHFADGSDPYVEKGLYAQAPVNYMIKVSYNF